MKDVVGSLLANLFLSLADSFCRRGLSGPSSRTDMDERPDPELGQEGLTYNTECGENFARGGTVMGWFLFTYFSPPVTLKRRWRKEGSRIIVKWHLRG
ncbi:hypothetical protein BKA61DRAFT_277494 [Leptodontidium sp. MPI-SDFR-AT-0119]|nr:hypothetical protein BKA61DRAFT_277494 [Leptodontidium sp. MPI-SDFR-AT-0119]